MTKPVSSAGLLSASAFNALVAMRRYMVDHQVTADEACSSLVSLSPDFASSNHSKAVTLHAKLPPNIQFDDIVSDRQHCLHFLIESDRPWWRKLFKSGREVVRTALSDDEQQVFADAGLLDVPPTASTRLWWYRMASIVRAERDQQQSESGGDAELRTLEYEDDRLRSLGINLQPQLVGFENNGLGYDIRSYDIGPHGPITRLIEVKSSSAKPPRMFIPRNEWNAAVKFGSSFFFYFWHGEKADELTIFTAKQMADHVPTDRGHGQWQDVEITFGTL